MTTIAALPADLSTLHFEQLKGADRSRSRELDRIFAAAGPGLDFTKVEIEGRDDTASKVEYARQLNDDLDRINLYKEGIGRVGRHPGFSNGPRGSSRPDGLPFGRVEGIGAEFMEKMYAALDGTSGGTLVQPFYDPQIKDLPQRSLFVRSLIPTSRATGDRVWYLRQSAATHAAAAVAAGAEKPKSTYTVERIETLVTTVAHVTEALDRALLSDHDGLVSFLDNQLRLGVLLEEEDQILNGTGVAPQLGGILTTAGIQTQAKGADTVPDAIYKAITKVRNQFTEPDGVVMHPNDWQDLRLLKDADGLYVHGAPADEAPERLFGLQVVVSPLIAEGTGLVGAFGVAAEVWDREQARVSFAETGLGDSAGQEMFNRNLVRYRGESRLAFGVIRPASFCQVTGI